MDFLGVFNSLGGGIFLILALGLFMVDIGFHSHGDDHREDHDQSSM